MRAAPRPTRGGTPRWYAELNLATGLFFFAALFAYPVVGTATSGGAAIAAILAVLGAAFSLDSMRIGKRARWEWRSTGPSLSARGIAAVVVLLLLAGIVASVNFSGPSLKPGWWFVLAVVVTFSGLVILGFRARGRSPPEPAAGF